MAFIIGHMKKQGIQMIIMMKMMILSMYKPKIQGLKRLHIRAIGFKINSMDTVSTHQLMVKIMWESGSWERCMAKESCTIQTVLCTTDSLSMIRKMGGV